MPSEAKPRHFLDTSALAKGFIKEAGSAVVRQLFRRSRPDALWISQLGILEMGSLLRRAQDLARLSPEDRRRVWQTFREHLGSRLQVWEFQPEDWIRAEALAERHGLRPPDALQLAGALGLADSLEGMRVVFVSSDHPLLRAARAENLAVLDPERAPPAPAPRA